MLCSNLPRLIQNNWNQPSKTCVVDVLMTGLHFYKFGLFCRGQSFCHAAWLDWNLDH